MLLLQDQESQDARPRGVLVKEVPSTASTAAGRGLGRQGCRGAKQSGTRGQAAPSQIHRVPDSNGCLQLARSALRMPAKKTSPHWGLSPGPSVYKTDGLPLSYRGI